MTQEESVISLLATAYPLCSNVDRFPMKTGLAFIFCTELSLNSKGMGYLLFPNLFVFLFPPVSFIFPPAIYIFFVVCT